MSAAVKPVALSEELADFIQRGRAPLERAHVALGDHPLHVLLGRGGKPYAAATLEQELVIAAVGDEAPAGGDHRALVLVQHALERTALEAPVGILSVHGEHLAKVGAGFLLDLAIELDERKLQ